MSKLFGAFALPTPEVVHEQIYQLTRGVSTTDAAVLETISSPEADDVAVIKVQLDDPNTTIAERRVYQYNGSSWVMLTKEVAADDVILTEDITMAGNYTQVGNKTKTQTGTATISAKGKSVAELLNEIFYKVVQPQIVKTPELATPVISVSGNREVGTVLSVDLSAASFDAGEYTFGPATGCTPTYQVKRVTDEGETVISSETDGSATDANLELTDDMGEVAYKVIASYTAGVVAKDNVGGDSNPAVQISAGSVDATSESIKVYRKFFTGSSTSDIATINSAAIRALTGSADEFAGEAEVSVAANSKIVIIAYPATYSDLTEIIDNGAMGANILSAFTKQTVSVEGANGYTAIDYKVYVYRPAAGLANATTYVAKV